jgi:hypothetical protein
MSDWNERYNAMKKAMGYTNSDIAEITGNTPESVKTVTRKGKELPRWVRLSIVIFEQLNTKNQEL